MGRGRKERRKGKERYWGKTAQVPAALPTALQRLSCERKDQGGFWQSSVAQAG